MVGSAICVFQNVYVPGKILGNVKCRGWLNNTDQVHTSLTHKHRKKAPIFTVNTINIYNKIIF